MLCQLFSTSHFLLSILPVPLQPLSYLLGLRMPLSFLFLPSPPLLFPPAPAFFLKHAPLLVLAAAVFFFHTSYRLSLPPRALPLVSHLF
jgi:hypothetical protein